MEITDALDFARDKRNGMLIALKSDGRPQSSNIAFAVGDDDVIRISVTDGRAKTANLRRDPRASLHINRDDFWAYVVIEADVTMLPVAASPDDATVGRRWSSTTEPSSASTTTGPSTARRWSTIIVSCWNSTPPTPTGCSTAELSQ